MRENEYSAETKKAIGTLQNLTGVVLHNINNLLAPFSLNMAKVEIYLECGKIDQLKKEMPAMVSNADVHLNAITESLRILFDTVSADREKIEFWDTVDIRNEVKKRVEKFLKPEEQASSASENNN